MTLPPGTPPGRQDLGSSVGVAAKREGEGRRPLLCLPPLHPSASGLANPHSGCWKLGRTNHSFPGWEEADGYGVVTDLAVICSQAQAGRPSRGFSGCSNVLEGLRQARRATARRQTHSKPACPWLGAALQQQEKWGDGAGMGALLSPPLRLPSLPCCLTRCW